MVTVERMGIERMLSLDIAGSPTDPLGAAIPAEGKREIRDYLEKHADRVSGLIPIDPSQPIESCRKLEFHANAIRRTVTVFMVRPPLRLIELMTS